ncbi:hypothetical protein DGI_1168 [Megalodesulfovibrio gigas DSM 1382 = ATCC 19364]|uniref:Uncharacterized protein n=1 Tax=Megalodesulfovibrio gigas (strain ATCC 19364 / DSM 1382 / NCIMB 9332 / VKM B-1759) TaxID=1121448 RepID=T2GA27_MEGG1|nr:hypothetical protein DGI_1168 [Megalodesulfovibrio gigas DSM 1382 = ATCC 19364]
MALRDWIRAPLSTPPRPAHPRHDRFSFSESDPTQAALRLRCSLSRRRRLFFSNVGAFCEF